MWGGIWRFIKRHRRKIVVSGVVVGGIVLLGRYARNKLRDFQDEEAAKYLILARKEHHFENNQRTCNTTVLAMIPSLREAITKALHTEELTALLKTKPDNKLDIWMELKVKSFSRMFVCVYASCVLVSVLRVRLNIIGGYMFVDHMMSSKNGLTHEHNVISDEIQKEYLHQVHYVMDKGLDGLVSAVLKATERAVGGIDLTSRISVRDLEDVVKKVRHEMEELSSNDYSDQNVSPLTRFMLPHSKQLEGAACREELILDKLNRETRDIMENVDMTAVLSLCLDHTFSLLLDYLTECFNTVPRSESPDQCLDPSMPMAKLIPIVDSTIRQILADMPNPYIKDQLLLEQGKDFSANVYEAFAHHPDTHPDPGR